MTQDQLDVLRRVAQAARDKDMDIGMSASVILALLDELDAARRVVAAARSFPNALILDVLDDYDALTQEAP